MQFRLVLHSHPSPFVSARGDQSASEPHGDLFIKNGEVLVTYEWPHAELPGPGDERFAKLITGDSGILLIRKQDHRLHYWTYEGEVSKGRGTVAELLRGEIEIDASFPGRIHVRPRSSS